MYEELWRIFIANTGLTHAHRRRVCRSCQDAPCLRGRSAVHVQPWLLQRLLGLFVAGCALVRNSHAVCSHGTCLPPSGNVVKCFCALVVTAKRSADELFMHYFHNLSSASRRFAPPHRHRGHRGPHRPPLRWGTFVPRPLICPPLEKILRAPMFAVSCEWPVNSL